MNIKSHTICKNCQKPLRDHRPSDDHCPHPEKRTEWLETGFEAVEAEPVLVDSALLELIKQWDRDDIHHGLDGVAGCIELTQRITAAGYRKVPS